MSRFETYLGDGAYAELSDVTGDLVIYTTVGGPQRTNEITLENDVLQALLDWLKSVEKVKP